MPRQLTVPALLLAAATAAAEDTVSVDTVVVESSAEAARHDGAAGKLGLPAQQDPQARTTIEREQLDARGAWTLREALRGVPGVAMAAGEGGRTGDSVTIRGFSAHSDLYLDGLKDNGQYFRDTFAAASVEVLRGASAVLFGRGATGGAVNVITRRPSDHWTGDAAVTTGEHGFLRATAGIGGPLVDDLLTMRLDAIYQTGGSFRDASRLDRVGVAPSLELSLGERTRIRGQVVHTSEASNMDYGVPMYAGRPAAVPVETYYGFRDDSFQDYDATLATVVVEHRLGEQIELRNATRHATYQRRYRTEILGSVNYTAGTVAVSQALRDNRQAMLVNQTELRVDRDIGQRRIRLVVGVEAARETYGFRSKNSTGVPAIDVFDPQQPDSVGAGRADEFDGTLNSDNRADTASLAGYALAAVDLVPDLTLVLGGRLDRFIADYRSSSAGYARSDTMPSPRAGLVWTPQPELSAYASYSTAFNPSAETFSLSAATADLEPERTRNLEAGLKAELLDRTLGIGLAVFRLEKTVARTSDPTNSTVQVLDGAQRTDGIEADASGRIGRRFTLTAGLALLNGEVLRSHNTTTTWDGQTVAVEGRRPINTPRASGSLWLACELGAGLTAAVGGTAISRVYTDQANSVALPGYVRADASLAYATRWADADWRCQLNLVNLFDTVHYEAGSSRSAYPGTPLAGQLTLRVAF